MQPIPYLFFNGTCGEALAAYGAVFGTTPELMTTAQMPQDVRAQMPDVPDDAVMHGALQVGEGMIFASDDTSGGAVPMAGCNIAVSLADDAETRRVFDALAEGGEVRMKLEPSFWTSLFGTLTDRFGTRWMIMTAYEQG